MNLTEEVLKVIKFPVRYNSTYQAIMDSEMNKVLDMTAWQLFRTLPEPNETYSRFGEMVAEAINERWWDKNTSWIDVAMDRMAAMAAEEHQNQSPTENTTSTTLDKLSPVEPKPSCE